MGAACRYLLGVFTLAVYQLALAVEGTRPVNPTPTVGSGSILQIIFSLLMVLAAIILVAWLLRRMNVSQQGSGNYLKVIGGVAVGQRERVVLVEIENTWLVIGVGPGQIRTLHTLPKSMESSTGITATPATIPFSARLKKLLEKRDAT